MKRITTIILIMTLFVGFALSQNAKIDSLKNVLHNSTTDKDKISVLLALTSAYTDTNLDSASIYGDKLLDLAERTNNKTYIIKAYKNIGLVHIYKGEIKKAIDFWERGSKIAAEINNLKDQADLQNNIAYVYIQNGDFKHANQMLLNVIKVSASINYEKRENSAYINLAILYHHRGLYVKANEYLHKALHYYERINDYNGMADIHNTLAIIAVRTDKHDVSKNELNKALQSYTKANNLRGKVTCLANFASVSIGKGNYEESFIHSKKANEIAAKIGLNDLQPIIYHNLALYYFNKKEFKLALQSYLKSLQLAKQSKGKGGVIRQYAGLSETYLAMNKLKLSKTYLDTAINIANTINATDLFIDIYGVQSQFYVKTKNYKKAYESELLKQKYKDSVLNKEKNMQIENLNIVYETEKKEQTIELQQKENDIQKAEIKQQRTLILIIILVFAVVITVIVAFILYRFQKQRQKILQMQVEAQERTRKEISSELHTDIGSELAATILKLESQGGATKETESIKKVYQHIRTASHILSLPDFIVSNIEEELNNMVSNFKTDNLEIEAKIFSKTGWKNVSPIVQQNIYRIVQELFTNSMKHSGASFISLQLIRRNKLINLIYEDDGKGYNPADVEHSKGYKDEIIARTKILNGSITDDSRIGEGVILNFTFPF